jgi:hypothetical protein
MAMPMSTPDQPDLRSVGVDYVGSSCRCASSMVTPRS